MKRRNEVILLIIFLLLAALLRIGYVALVSHPPIEKDDAYYYDKLASNICEGKGFVMEEGKNFVGVGPLYPFFLALIYKLFSHSLFTVRFLQALLSILTCYLIYLIARRIFNSRIGILSLFIAAVYYPFIVFCGRIITETLNIFLLTLSIYFLILALDDSKKLFFILSGLCLGLTALCRSGIILFPLFVLIFMVIKYFRTKTKFILSFLIFLICFIVVISPWTIRNYTLYHRFIPVSTGGGATFWAGNYLPYEGIWPDIDPEYKRICRDNNVSIDPFSPETDSVFLQEGIKNISSYIKKSPLSYLNLLNKKAFYFFKGPQTDYRLEIFHYPYSIYGNYRLDGWDILLIFALFGLAFSFSQWKRSFIIFLPILYFFLFHLITFSYTRYSLQVFPFLIIFTSFGIVALVEEISRSKKKLVALVLFLMAMAIDIFIFYTISRDWFGLNYVNKFILLLILYIGFIVLIISLFYLLSGAKRRIVLFLLAICFISSLIGVASDRAWFNWSARLADKSWIIRRELKLPSDLKDFSGAVLKVKLKNAEARDFHFQTEFFVNGESVKIASFEDIAYVLRWVSFPVDKKFLRGGINIVDIKVIGKPDKVKNYVLIYGAYNLHNGSSFFNGISWSSQDLSADKTGKSGGYYILLELRK